MRRVLTFLYGLVCYLLFFGTFLYTIGFLADLGTPTTIDRGIQSPLWVALLVDTGLLAIFALQHSVMARPGFKRAWTRLVPQPVERSTYVLATCLALWLLFWQWRPIPGIVWETEGSLAFALGGLYLLGYGVVFYATVLISHFDLFGLRQVALFARGRAYTHLPFETPQVYKNLRHPLYVGWFIVFWATPVMTWGHLFFAAVCTTYILLAIQLEERDLVAHFGETYDRYRKQVPMFVPRLGRSARAEDLVSASR